MKAVIVQNVKEAYNIKEVVDAYILPIKDFSINYENTFTLEDIEEVISLKKDTFVMVNKNIHNSELEDLKKLLLKLNEFDIKGVFFYDTAVLTLRKKLGLKFDLVWSQEHLTTNFKTINFWYDMGAKYTYLSSELNRKEIEEIIKKSKAKLFINVFGYLPMFTSRRHLVKNYLNSFNIKDGNKDKVLYKEEKKYKIIDTKNGTTVYSNYILNIKEKINLVYLVYNSYKVDNIKEILTHNTYEEELGFLDKEVIYKVKEK